MHSAVLLETMTGHPWNGDNMPLDDVEIWQSSTLDNYAAFRTAGFSQGHMTSGKTTWKRAVTASIRTRLSPAILIRDTFDGEQAGSNKVFSLNLMAEGPVQPPLGR